MRKGSSSTAAFNLERPRIIRKMFFNTCWLSVGPLVWLCCAAAAQARLQSWCSTQVAAHGSGENSLPEYLSAAMPCLSADVPQPCLHTCLHGLHAGGGVCPSACMGHVCCMGYMDCMHCPSAWAMWVAWAAYLSAFLPAGRPLLPLLPPPPLHPPPPTSHLPLQHRTCTR